MILSDKIERLLERGDRILDKISREGIESSGGDIVLILRLNSLMDHSSGKARGNRHKLLALLVRQCACSLFTR